MSEAEQSNAVTTVRIMATGAPGAGKTALLEKVLLPAIGAAGLGAVAFDAMPHFLDVVIPPRHFGRHFGRPRFVAGETVWLRSGGPRLTVTECRGEPGREIVAVTWYSEPTGHFAYSEIPAVALQPVPFRRQWWPGDPFAHLAEVAVSAAGERGMGPRVEPVEPEDDKGAAGGELRRRWIDPATGLPYEMRDREPDGVEAPEPDGVEAPEPHGDARAGGD
jgi:uncharacterized protein YodC (DUF2158 family)